MAISAKLVKQLRDQTGVGMMDAKKALQETDGDIDKAVDYLRESGQMKAAKKADRVAAEGLAKIYIEGNTAAILEVNTETDFAAKNDKFTEIIDEIGHALVQYKPQDMEEAKEKVEINGESLEDYLTQKTAIIGERINFRRFTVFEKTDDQVFGQYVHMGGKIATLVLVNSSDDQLALNLALHVSGIAPKYVSEEQIPQEERDHEREVLTEQAKNEGKPEKIIEKMVEGRMHKFYAEVCLNDQDYLLNDSMTVKELLDKEDASVEDFRRYAVGEGIERKEEDFAAEVQSQMR
ncbi:translation elongation factor Ts [Aerococcus mictus]|uniref:translation elongation factor Ts n=1 Tax=Aerococcus mictus TaxID=2976810 RepID=UPI00227A4BD8|nr:translation elongation factor Ts [Aerococcus mictus]MCY3034357.1 translation elongation factor Ts [Aerococcus mictus]